MQRSRSNLGSNSSSVALELDSPVISLLNDNWLDSKHKGEIKTLKGTHSETKAHDVMPLKGSRVKPEHMKVQLRLETDLTWRVIAVFCFKTRPVRETVCVCVCLWVRDRERWNKVAASGFLFTFHEIHKRHAARGILWDGDEPQGAADERSEAAKHYKNRDLQSHWSELHPVVSN